MSVQAFPETLYDYPLFGTEKPARAVRPARTGGKIALEPLEPRETSRFGDQVSYRVSADRPGYLYLLGFKPNNTVACLFPNALDANNKITAGTHAFPRNDGYAYQVVKPLGPELVAAVLAPEPLAICDKMNASWADILWRLRSRALLEALGALPGTTLDQALVKTAAGGAESPADIATLRLETAP